MRVCGNCGQELQGNAKFCRSCGCEAGSYSNVQTQQSQSSQSATCGNCGAPLNPDMKFCKACGMAVNGGYNQTGYRQEEADGYTDHGMYYESGSYPKKRSSSGVVVAMAVLLTVIVIAISVVAYMLINKNDDPTPADDPNGVETIEPTVIAKKERVDEAIRAYIQDNGINGNVSVAIHDNQTGETFEGVDSQTPYTAWGLYLPIYLIYGECNGYDASLRRKIMSSDPATCNASANSAITHIGGLERVNGLLTDFYGTINTSYGRWFGQTGNSAANTTTANDAVVFLTKLNETGEYSLMSYNLASFGINTPAGAKVYAHAGSENRNVRNNLNLFAVVKGANSDYCITIMTNNATGGHITGLLNTIHAEMEKDES